MFIDLGTQTILIFLSNLLSSTRDKLDWFARKAKSSNSVDNPDASTSPPKTFFCLSLQSACFH